MGDINLYDTNKVLQKKIGLNASNRVSVKDATGVEVIDIENHGALHGYGASQAIPADALRFSQIDKVFGTETTLSVEAGSTAVISKGIYYVRCDTNVSIEYSPDGGTTWVTIIPAGGAGLIISDGSNVRANNAGVGAENVYLLPIE